MTAAAGHAASGHAAADLAALDDDDLVARAAHAIHVAAVAGSSLRFGDGFYDEVDAVWAECERRTPGGNLYARAWNRAAGDVCGPHPVPPDPRRGTAGQ